MIRAQPKLSLLYQSKTRNAGLDSRMPRLEGAWVQAQRPDETREQYIDMESNRARIQQGQCRHGPYRRDAERSLHMFPTRRLASPGRVHTTQVMPLLPRHHRWSTHTTSYGKTVRRKEKSIPPRKLNRD